jgi:predicted transcriptional regulator
VQTEKLKPVTVRVDSRVWRHVERLAAADKRPVANLLRVILSDYVAAKSGQQKSQVAA